MDNKLLRRGHIKTVRTTLCSVAIPRRSRPSFIIYFTSRVAQGKRQKLMAHCNIQASFGCAMPIVKTTILYICRFHEVFVPTKELMWTFGIDH